MVADEISWDPAGGSLDRATLEGLDAVVHLAGAGLADVRWSEARKVVLHDSRVRSTQRARAGARGPGAAAARTRLGLGDRLVRRSRRRLGSASRAIRGPVFSPRSGGHGRAPRSRRARPESAWRTRAPASCSRRTAACWRSCCRSSASAWAGRWATAGSGGAGSSLDDMLAALAHAIEHEDVRRPVQRRRALAREGRRFRAHARARAGASVGAPGAGVRAARRRRARTRRRSAARQPARAARRAAAHGVQLSRSGTGARASPPAGSREGVRMMRASRVRGDRAVTPGITGFTKAASWRSLRHVRFPYRFVMAAALGAAIAGCSSSPAPEGSAPPPAAPAAAAAGSGIVSGAPDTAGAVPGSPNALYVFRFKQIDPSSSQFNYRDRDLSFYFRPSPSGLYFRVENLQGRPVQLDWDHSCLLRRERAFGQGRPRHHALERPLRATRLHADRRRSSSSGTTCSRSSTWWIPVPPPAPTRSRTSRWCPRTRARPPTRAARSESTSCSSIEDRPRTYPFRFQVASVIPR